MVIRRFSVLMLLTALVFTSVVLPALATEGEGETEPPAEVTTDEVSGGMAPAVELEADAPEDSSLDWTYRYMIPTGIVLGVLVIIVTAAQYFTSVVRKRYRIVEE